jgi:exodeoxyribonuclease VII small subunit
MTDKPSETRSPETMSFEEVMQELEQIVTQLENEQMSLDQSLELFERGQLLGNHCLQVLENAELKVSQLTPRQRQD